MFNTRVLGAAAAAALLPLTLSAMPAQAACLCSDTAITAKASDRTPASGQEFSVRGRFVDAGEPAANQVVKVQTLRDGHWEQLSGAKVRTSSEGRYRVRLVLSQRGDRDLRVVGVAAGEGPNARKRFTVRVH